MLLSCKSCGTWGRCRGTCFSTQLLINIPPPPPQKKQKLLSLSNKRCEAKGAELVFQSASPPISVFVVFLNQWFSPAFVSSNRLAWCYPFSIGCCWLPQALGLICAERGKLWLGKLSSMGVDRLCDVHCLSGKAPDGLTPQISSCLGYPIFNHHFLRSRFHKFGSVGKF